MSLNDHVLVIADDDPEICSAYSTLLQQKGFVVHTCGDGARAIELCRNFPPAVPLLDLDMPVLNGWQTAQQLRADPELAELRLVAISALTDELSSSRAWEAGFHEFLPKPIPTSMLLAIVRPTRHLRGIIDRT